MEKLSIFKRLIGLLEPSEKSRYYRHAVMSLFSILLDVFSISMLLPILRRISSSGYADRHTVMIIFALGFLMLVKGIFDLWLVRLQNRWRCESVQKLSSKVYSLLLREDLMDHNDRNEGEIITCVRSDVAASMATLSTVEGILANVFSFIGCLCILVYAIGWLGLVCGAVYVVAVIIVHALNNNKTFVLGEKLRKLEMSLIGMIGSSFYSYKEVKNDSRKDRLESKFGGVAQEYSSVSQRYSMLSSMLGSFLQSMIQAAIFFLLLLVVTMDVNLVSIIPSLIVLITVIIKMIPMALGVIGGLNSMSFAKKACLSTLDNMDKYRRVKADEEEQSHIRHKQVTINDSLKIKDLTFAYPNGKLIFDHAEMEVPVGKSVAVIGPSGEGKTTLLDLVVGLLKPQSGSILFDDYDIVTHTDNEGECIADMGSIVSYIPQFIAVGHNTVRDIVSFMATPEDVDEERLVNCLKCAKIYDDVMEMPDGLDTMLGHSGHVISGGQKQRLGLARALYKDFELLVMDEATAALDMGTEMAVIDSIREMKKGKTLLIVTHHKSLSDECEIIYRIEDKKLKRIR